ncbi:hypothetical protein EI94DRAFT_1702523 [Lactarius quietus]|nr:hypothetical protein EI94DRAFT_1702523 [Lactarius quietus]
MRGSLAVSLALGESVGVRPATAGGDGGVALEGHLLEDSISSTGMNERHLRSSPCIGTTEAAWDAWHRCGAPMENAMSCAILTLSAMCEEPRGQGEAKGGDVARRGKVGVRRVVRAGWEDQGGWAKGEGAAWWEDWDERGNG